MPDDHDRVGTSEDILQQLCSLGEQCEGPKDMVTNDLNAYEQRACKQSQKRSRRSLIHTLLETPHRTVVIHQGRCMKFVDGWSRKRWMRDVDHPILVFRVCRLVWVSRRIKAFHELRVLVENRNRKKSVKDNGLVLSDLKDLTTPEVLVENAAQARRGPRQEVLERPPFILL